jgi:hypothetical protein
VAAGRHTVSVDAPAGPAEVDCPDGGARTVSVAAAAPRPPSRARAWKLGLGGAAAALALGSLAGLVTAAAYHHRDACDGERCAYRYDATAGIALGAVGVAAFGGAAAALLAAARREPVVTIAPASDGVALVGRF